MTAPGSLRGRRVVVTREAPGRLGELLESRGATVVSVPLIAVADPVDGGVELRERVDRLAEFDWLVVTSPAGAVRVGDAARQAPAIRLAAVGSSTAAALSAAAGRAVDLVPDDQRSSALADALAGLPPARVFLALADRAPATLAESLAAAGHSVTSVVAYRTVPVTASQAARASAHDADALLLASGSAAESWVEQIGVRAPAVVVAIGPSTAEVARRSGLKVDGVAADHSVTGLVAELERCFRSSESSD